LFVVLCYFYCFVCTTVGLLSPGESRIAVVVVVIIIIIIIIIIITIIITIIVIIIITTTTTTTTITCKVGPMTGHKDPKGSRGIALFFL
jgi:hypothetical protein